MAAATLEKVSNMFLARELLGNGARLLAYRQRVTGKKPGFCGVATGARNQVEEVRCVGHSVLVTGNYESFQFLISGKIPPVPPFPGKVDF